MTTVQDSRHRTLSLQREDLLDRVSTEVVGARWHTGPAVVLRSGCWGSRGALWEDRDRTVI